MRQIHGRLDRFARPQAASSVPDRSRSHRAPGGDASVEKPPAATGTIARAVADYQQAHRKNPNAAAALQALVAAHGSETPANLDAAKISQVTQGWTGKKQHTRANYSKALRSFLRHLEETADAPKAINRTVARVNQPSPRGVVATDDERERMLAAATPRLRFFLLLCGDLGIRHRTATRIALENWHPLTRSLSFTTKGNVHQTLPVTDAIADMIHALPAGSSDTTPIVTLLRPPKQEGHPPGKAPRFLKAFNKLKEQLGIRADLHIHDLRRTAAEDVWEATKDIRMVQAQLGHRSPITTVRYLANKVQLQDLQPVIAKVEAMRAARRGKP